MNENYEKKLYGLNDIFNSKEKYTISFQQNGYIWDYEELITLLEEVKNISKSDKEYCLGTLFVVKNNDGYEVIEGHQRFINIYILLNCLGINTNSILKFTYCEKSNYTLNNIKSIISSMELNDDTDENILSTIKIFNQEIVKKDFNKEEFKKKLEKTVVCLVLVSA